VKEREKEVLVQHLNLNFHGKDQNYGMKMIEI
jgi:hypothetical protein